MSVASTDIKIYGAANIAETNGVTQGGAIDTSVRYVFNDATLITNNDTFNVVSSDGGDTTQTVTITGRNAGGSIVTEDFALNGATPVTGATTFAKIMKIVCDAAHTGTITVTENSGSQTLLTMESGVLEVRIPFYNVAADVGGGSSRDFYEKVFIKNTNGTDSLLGMTVSEQADPSSNITFDLEDAIDDTNSTASRLNTAPTGMLGSFDSSSKSLPGTDLAAGEAIGVWLKLTLAAGAAAADSTYTLRTSGTTV